MVAVTNLTAVIEKKAAISVGNGVLGKFNKVYLIQLSRCLCDKEISKTLPERVRIYLNSKFKITFLSRSVEAPRSSSEFLSCHCIPTQLSLQRVILLGHV